MWFEYEGRDALSHRFQITAYAWLELGDIAMDATENAPTMSVG